MTPEVQLQTALAYRDRVERGDLMIGIMDPAEVERMFELFQDASHAGLAAASFAWGQTLLMYAVGEPDPDAAIAAYRTAEAQGYGRDATLQMLRTAYFYAPDGLTDDEIHRAFATLLEDDPTGEIALLRGYASYRGFGHTEDHAEAIRWHQVAAAKGNADAMFELSVLVSAGAGTTRDPDAALDWVRRAADAGSARAMYNLGAFYATGNGVDLDPGEAVRWYQRAADLGHGRAAAVLSVMFYTGEGVTADRENARRYYDLAWELGADADAFYDQLEISPEFA